MVKHGTDWKGVSFYNKPGFWITIINNYYTVVEHVFNSSDVSAVFQTASPTRTRYRGWIREWVPLFFSRRGRGHSECCRHPGCGITRWLMVLIKVKGHYCLSTGVMEGCSDPLPFSRWFISLPLTLTLCPCRRASLQEGVQHVVSWTVVTKCLHLLLQEVMLTPLLKHVTSG